MVSRPTQQTLSASFSAAPVHVAIIGLRARTFHRTRAVSSLQRCSPAWSSALSVSLLSHSLYHGSASTSSVAAPHGLTMSLCGCSSQSTRAKTNPLTDQHSLFMRQQRGTRRAGAMSTMARARLGAQIPATGKTCCWSALLAPPVSRHSPASLTLTVLALPSTHSTLAFTRAILLSPRVQSV